MGVVYTISHPFTDDIFYVGWSKSLTKRRACHLASKNEVAVSAYIKHLLNNYILPKFEVIDICDSDDAMYIEKYWINQLKAWGFNLLNKNGIIKSPIRNKYIPVKQRTVLKNSPILADYQKKIVNSYIKKPIFWSREKFQLGYSFIINVKRKNSFRELFRQNALKFGVPVCLSFQTLNDSLVATVVEKLPKAETYGKTKSGAIRYAPLQNKPKVERRQKQPRPYKFHTIKIGDALIVPYDKLASFHVCLKNYNNRHGTNIKYALQYDANNNGNITFVSPETTIENPPIHRIRKNGRVKLTADQKIQIKNSTEKVRVLALRYNVSEALIYKTRLSPH